MDASGQPMTVAAFFADQWEFRAWLDVNHATAIELVVGFYKVGSGRGNLTWSEAVDQALCYGWIDGVRRKIDAQSYCNRFTPRRTGSNWSAVNIKKVEALTSSGLMRPAGIAAFERRTEDRSRVYSFETGEVLLDPDLEAHFRADPAAWEYFCALAPSYRRLSIHWLMSAKRPETRLARLHRLMGDCARRTNMWKDNVYAKGGGV